MICRATHDNNIILLWVRDGYTILVKTLQGQVHVPALISPHTPTLVDSSPRTGPSIGTTLTAIEQRIGTISKTALARHLFAILAGAFFFFWSN
eukprot:CAMPEP_0183316804 /NCGR_PEP_ID=MMETSP0160_2-20130417/56071_1 /TAXON_ID=2839 ORGANISM="Odontella Sinensis, Strain Grunow 1884" /NCGR_SAMPLE_ID=MMETSP0160_2 /ASSEMBLY_ACC=CAM_ASM_000250 /LENGTH=92 /DNA_ID=CAMNT_0025482689 /DNA_START=395 /DNA_END=673 /DNA_ORIENTATION=+